MRHVYKMMKNAYLVRYNHVDDVLNLFVDHNQWFDGCVSYT